MKLEFCRQILGKSSDIKFHTYLSSGNRVVPCGRTDVQTDRHDEANNRFSQIWERAKKRYHHYICTTQRMVYC